MMKHLFVFFGIVCMATLCLAQTRQALEVYRPADAGQASPGFYPLHNAFDAQPTLQQLTEGRVFVDQSGKGLGANVPSFPRRAGYIDFGSEHRSVRIVSLWTAYRSSSNYDGRMPFADVFWSDVISDVRGAQGTFTNVDPATLNFGTKAVNTEGDVVAWIQDFDFSRQPVLPPRRYLILVTGENGFAADRATEFAIVVAAQSRGRR